VQASRQRNRSSNCGGNAIVTALDWHADA